MKNLPLLLLCASLVAPLTGCVNCEPSAGSSYASGCGCHGQRSTYDWYCRNDGYSFNYDPYNRDMLAPTLGLDPMFPPPYIPACNN